MLTRLVERQMATTSIDQLTEIALQALDSPIPRVLSGGLRLLRTIVQDTKFVQFEAAEQAALRCADYDNTWVKRDAQEVLTTLLQKNKLKNRTLTEHAANRSAHSSNDGERSTGSTLLNLLASTKHQNIFLFLGAALTFLLLCSLLCSWTLRTIRNRRLRAMSKLGNKDWSYDDLS